MPLAGAYAIVSAGGDVPEDRSADVATVGALAAWRVTKGIYSFDSTVLDALWHTPVTGDIPVEVLERLPEWCCYIPLPPRQILYDTCRGFFVHLEHDVNTGRRELRLLLDYEPLRLVGIPLHLVGGLPACVEAMMEESYRLYREARRPAAEVVAQGVAAASSAERLMADIARDSARELEPLISLTLYLCSTTAEIRGRDVDFKPLRRPSIKFTKRGPRLFPPPEASMWEVAYRLGATLRAAGPGVSGPDRGGTHASPRPHIRRAHWHAFWTGPKASRVEQQTGERRLVLKWLPPIPVAVGEDDVIPTVHRVVIR